MAGAYNVYGDNKNGVLGRHSLRGLNPLERICQCWTEEPETYRLNPLHHIAGGTEHLASAEMNSISRDSIVAEADKVGRRIWAQVQAAGPIAIPGRPRQR